MSELITTPSGFDVRVTRDIAYADRGGTALELDLYRPEVAGEVPTVVYLHGGGFAMGRRTDLPERLVGVAQRGVAVASASYRLVDKAIYPAQLEDVRDAVRWVRRHGGSHGLDTTRVGIWGASAGAALAMLTGFAPDPDGSAADASVQAVVSWFGPADLTFDGEKAQPTPGLPVPESIIEFAQRDGMVMPPDPTFYARLVGVEKEEEGQEALLQASPLTHVNGQGPPLLLMHGDSDAMLSLDHSRWLFDKVREDDGDVSLLILAGANHEDEMFHRGDALGAVAAFLHERLSPARPTIR
ncbi:alpha/beta hydrolase [Streptomyces sp. NPDC047081]|uniref:alpha/beta hydrolase n=1 Tax=Streptomyces sp. NPDC047081 TaxID=3154706 RepID=UPI0033D2127D